VRSLLAVAAALSLLILPAAAAAAPAKGLMDERLPRSDDPALRAEFFDVAKRAHVGFVRTYISWDGSHAAPFPQEIAAIRRYATEAAAQGIDTMFVGFNGEVGLRYDDARDVSLKRYRSMVRSSAEALRGLPVKLVWSPLNEANILNYLPKTHGPEVWRRIQNIAYDTIKAVDPRATVVAGELAPYARNARSTDPGRWVQQALGLDARFRPRPGTRARDHALKADGWTLHSYDYRVDPARPLRSDTRWTIRNLARTRTLLNRVAGTRRLPKVAAQRVYITEFAYLFAPGTKQTVPDATGAAWTRKAWEIASRAGVRGFLWFQVRDPAAVFFSGLRTMDGRDRPVLSTFVGLR
jgi:hypothetical protein